ncbi:MAG: methyltransferase [Actinomycetota bacterium]|nr:methyltransferase [Actinomycetota bacterium]
MEPEPDPRLVARLRAAGCVFAEDETREILRVLGRPAEIEAAVLARAGGMPLEQVLGRAVFMGLEIVAEPGVFVPRQRTDQLVGTALASGNDPRVVVDLGCGSGALAAVLSRKLPSAQVHACDVDPVALACARRNAEWFRYVVHQGSWWSALPTVLSGRVDLAVAYLPHVPTRRLAMIPRDLREHEPVGAVDGGPDGLEPFREVLSELDGWLAADGRLVTLLAREQADEAAVAAGRRKVVIDEYDDDVVLTVFAS